MCKRIPLPVSLSNFLTHGSEKGQANTRERPYPGKSCSTKTTALERVGFSSQKTPTQHRRNVARACDVAPVLSRQVNWLPSGPSPICQWQQYLGDSFHDGSFINCLIPKYNPGPTSDMVIQRPQGDGQWLPASGRRGYWPVRWCVLSRCRDSCAHIGGLASAKRVRVFSGKLRNACINQVTISLAVF